MEQLQFALGKPQKRRRRRGRAAPAKDAAFSAAVSAATEILQWRLGPNPPQWRIFRLAQALKDGA